ncbi:hypothetical protein V6N13_043268 [Hibiscus sabdariffa]|uniref:Uncharacterized protein n=2 Tax=Hibiscus sabdariffa TaxID=183260 RepID=A0ABR1Z8X1_9ROSI
MPTHGLRVCGLLEASTGLAEAPKLHQQPNLGLPPATARVSITPARRQWWRHTRLNRRCSQRRLNKRPPSTHNNVVKHDKGTSWPTKKKQRRCTKAASTKPLTPLCHDPNKREVRSVEAYHNVTAAASQIWIES